MASLHFSLCSICGVQTRDGLGSDSMEYASSQPTHSVSWTRQATAKELENHGLWPLKTLWTLHDSRLETWLPCVFHLWNGDDKTYLVELWRAENVCTRSPRKRLWVIPYWAIHSSYLCLGNNSFGIVCLLICFPFWAVHLWRVETTSQLYLSLRSRTKPT